MWRAGFAEKPLSESSLETSATIKALGEFGLIARLTAGLSTRPDVLVGVGDDCAVLDLGGELVLLATCDALLDGEHFLRRVATPEQIGRRALAVNLSDIASMGGWPRYALISLLLPADLPTAFMDEVYRGLRAEAEQYGAVIIGGNITGSSTLGIDITLLGQARRGQALLRGGASPGDALLMTGTLGEAAAGLHLLLHPEIDAPAPIAGRLKAAQLAPMPRVPEGRLLAALGTVTAMLDISDGLAADLGHLCERSGVGARLDEAALPIPDAVHAAAQLARASALDWALFGGEDYQLLFTAPPRFVPRLIETIWIATGTPVTVIGDILSSEAGLTLRARDGSIRPLPPRGWDHLRSSAP
jgi:thiamine-monophosphate kinase